MTKIIDVHTHMLNDKWLDAILEYGGNYTLKESVSYTHLTLPTNSLV